MPEFDSLTLKSGDKVAITFHQLPPTVLTVSYVDVCGDIHIVDSAIIYTRHGRVKQAEDGAPFLPFIEDIQLEYFDFDKSPHEKHDDFTQGYRDFLVSSFEKIRASTLSDKQIADIIAIAGLRFEATPPAGSQLAEQPVESRNLDSEIDAIREKLEEIKEVINQHGSVLHEIDAERESPILRRGERPLYKEIK